MSRYWSLILFIIVVLFLSGCLSEINPRPQDYNF
jgi:PBP1b-binding outer membrane lipoprotein LpoB